MISTKKPRLAAGTERRERALVQGITKPILPLWRGFARGAQRAPLAKTSALRWRLSPRMIAIAA
jgi:hypothetical protein